MISGNTKLIIEYNTYGSILLQYLQTVFPGRNDFEDEMVLRFKHRHDSKTLKPGIRLKSDNKSVFCQNFKKQVENGKIKVNELMGLTGKRGRQVQELDGSRN